MTKLPPIRVNDTKDYIRNTMVAGMPQGIRNDIVELTNRATPWLGLRAVRSYVRTSASMSVKDHIATGVASGNATEREQRRSIVLLWSSMGGANPAPEVATRRDDAMRLPPNQLADAFEHAMICAAAYASNQGAAWVFNNVLAAHPLSFIRRFRLIIVGSGVGLQTFQTPGNGPWQNTTNYSFYYMPVDDMFYLSPDAPPGSSSHTTLVVSVPMVHWSHVPGRGNDMHPTAQNPAGFDQMLATELAGAPFMVTGQITGCAFNMMGGGNTVWASHVHPAAMGGPTLANQLLGNVANVTAGDFANFPGNGANPPLSIFGMTAGNAPVHGGGNPYYPAITVGRFVTVFGRQSAGGWKIYAQTHTHNNTIHDARRIF